MATSEPGILALALLSGGALGAMFFGGLWWTVLRGASSATPARWFFASALLRMGLTLAGFYVVAGGQADRLVLCLLGFVIARMIVTRLTKPRAHRHALPTRPTKEIRRAP
jgi:F1F0 ATPase subunit 2